MKRQRQESTTAKRDLRDVILQELNLKKTKKQRKTWRFPYEMYCKELVTGKD